jgi:hypothetical protein
MLDLGCNPGLAGDFYVGDRKAEAERDLPSYA